MKRNSKTYRLQLIKEAVEKRERRLCNDPMVRYIEHLLEEKPTVNKEMNQKHRFIGHHYDEQAGGWVSDRWSH